MAAFHGKSRRGEQAFVEQLELFRLFLLRDEPVGKLDEQVGKREQQRRGKDVECRMHEGDVCGAGSFRQERHGNERFCQIKEQQKCSCANDVKEQMNDCGAFGVARGAAAGDQRRHAGADVLPADDRNDR